MALERSDLLYALVEAARQRCAPIGQLLVKCARALLHLVHRVLRVSKLIVPLRLLELRDCGLKAALVILPSFG